MTAPQNFLIGTINEGITTNTRPWATPEDSWEELINMYQFRGRVVKKAPYTQLGQLSFLVTALNLGASSTNFTSNIFTVPSPNLVGVTVIPGSITITNSGGAAYTIVEDPLNPGQLIQTSGVNFISGAINYITGVLTLNFSVNPAGNVLMTFSYAYGLPVMGLRTRELFSINEQDTIGFDTKYSYRFSNISKQFIGLPSVMPTVWSGANYQFFYTTNYAGAFWATNSKPGLHGAAISNISQAVNGIVTTVANHGFTTGQTVVFINVSGMVQINGLSSVITVITPTTFSLDTINTTAFTAYASGGFALNSSVSSINQDGIRFYGDLTNGTGWSNYNPPVNTSVALAGALLIFPYRGYLVFLNTYEGNESGVENFGNRARWTKFGTPFYSLPTPVTPNIQGVDVTAARDDIFGGAAADDAPTQEVIVSASFIRDILIVRFERSTWRLRFVNNAQNPFSWERINVEFGSDCTFGSIVFNDGAIDISERGITIADANSVHRTDDKIPDIAFDFRIKNQGLQRVYGIRTFQFRLVYWTMPSVSNPTGTYPDLVLVYNYDSKTYAQYDDCFTCFGYFYAFDDTTWNDLPLSWSTYDYIYWGGDSLNSGNESIIAGNQQGFVLTLQGETKNKQANSNFQNGASLMITSVTNGTPTVFNSKDNNLPDGSWIVLSGLAGNVVDSNGISLNGRSFRVVNPSLHADNFSLEFYEYYAASDAIGSNFAYILSSPFIPVFPGSVNIYVGSLHFVDNGSDGILSTSGASTGTIDYSTGSIALNFSPPLGGATPVYIYIVSQDPGQLLRPLFTTGTYTGGGYISKTSNFSMKSKYFNFLKGDQRVRLSKIDFYVNKTMNGEFQCDILADSSNQIVNTPLPSNPRSNIVKTTLNPRQYGEGIETIFRLFSNAVGQTLQFQFSNNDRQMAIPQIVNSDIQIVALNVSIRPGGRLI